MLELQIPVVRYEHAAPGDVPHIDIKKFARIVKAGHRITGNSQDETRGAGWEFLYVAVDDHSRCAYTALSARKSRLLGQLPGGGGGLLPTLRHHHPAACSPTTGPCFYAHRFAHTCRHLGITHQRSRIYTPRTNGKAERFIQAAIHERAYARRYENSEQKSAQLIPWIDPPVQLASSPC